MSGIACEYVKAHTALFAKEHNDYGYAYEEDLCDVETLLVAASAMNPGCDANDDGRREFTCLRRPANADDYSRSFWAVIDS
jgi:hypothetical protein